MATVTYTQAKQAILSHLASNGWVMSDSSLKIPHATRGNVRLWFKSQAVYLSHTTHYSQKHEFKNARSHTSEYLDIRKMSAAEFVETVASRFTF